MREFKEDCRHKCSKASCDLCTTIIADPLEMVQHGARLLTVKIKIKDICFDKKVAVAVIIYDQCHRIVAFRGFTKKLRRDDKCCESSCGTIERKLVFVLPDGDEFDPSRLNIVTKANYIFPCNNNRRRDNCKKDDCKRDDCRRDNCC
jgi:hypothetical protein